MQKAAVIKQDFVSSRVVWEPGTIVKGSAHTVDEPSPITANAANARTTWRKLNN